MLFTSLKGIYLNCVKLRAILTRTCLPSFVSFDRTSATLQDIYNSFSISRTFQSTPETLRIEFKDSLAAEFYYIWLRDNCNCDKCIHPYTKQKRLDSMSLSLKLAPRFCHVTNTGKLKIIWPEKYGEHYSHYDPGWLHRYALGFDRNLYEKVHDCLPSVTCWTGRYLEENLPEIEYEEVMHSQRGVYLALEKIHTLGMLFVRNVPSEPGEVVKVMNQIADIKSTRWGSSFHISTGDIFDDPAYLPYAEKSIELHTDMDYLEKSPGIRIVHCLETTRNISSSTEVENSNRAYFVDGFHIANLLKEHYPVYFETLVSVPVKFRMFTQNMQYVNYQPMFKLNTSRDVTEVHFNNRMMAPLEGPSKSIVNFYVARKIFGEYIGNPENQFETPLKTGDMVIINNRRVLHGRQNFDPKQSTKHLEGGYADMDDVLARYRTFLKKTTTDE